MDAKTKIVSYIKEHDAIILTVNKGRCVVEAGPKYTRRMTLDQMVDEGLLTHSSEMILSSYFCPISRSYRDASHGEHVYRLAR